MKFFNNLGIAPKILAVLALFSALALGLSALAITSLADVYGETKVFTGAFDRSIAGGRATANLLAFARNVEFLLSISIRPSAPSTRPRPPTS